MKLIFVLCLFAVVGLSMAEPVSYPRGCIYVMGRCHRECEVGTHAYTTGCGFKQPEATCANPKPELDTRGKICDYSACYCDEPTVRDTATGKCVPLEECTKKSIL
ncbi:jg17252 [Pararge aegeria aegeria]|uniref:Jg17252 protein n=2 Tax=Pararge aegeria TaxID=116150 RepID=A0A8S4RIK8_9NEOP|nr:jg17252 [Pararge aegeria aegeria]